MGVSRSALSSSARMSPRSAIVRRTRSPRANDVSSAASSGGRSRAVARSTVLRSVPVAIALPGHAQLARADPRHAGLDVGHLAAGSERRDRLTNGRQDLTGFPAESMGAPLRPLRPHALLD